MTVTVRLLDTAVDKLPTSLPPIEGAGQALGLQGTRLYGAEPVAQVINAQPAALLDLLNRERRL